MVLLSAALRAQEAAPVAAPPAASQAVQPPESQPEPQTAPRTAAQGAEGQAPSSEEQTPDRIAVVPGAGAPAQLSERRFDGEQIRARLDAHWFRRKGLLEHGSWEAADAELATIAETCAEAGIERITPIAVALVHEGDGYLLEGNFARARASFNGALSLAPDLALARWGLARSSWAAGDGLAKAGAEALRALAGQAGESLRGFHGLANGMIVGAWAAFLMLWIFSLILLVRYERAFRHDISEWLIRARPATGQLAGAVLLAAPLLLWYPAPWAPAWWIGLLSRYARPLERAAGAVLLVALLVSGPLAPKGRTVARVASDPGSQLLLSAAGGAFEPDAVLALEEQASAHVDDAFYPSLLGAVYARGRFLEEALAQFRKASTLAPADPRPVNDAGNLFLEAGRAGEAAQEYRRAIEIDASFLPPYVNLYLARQAMFDFTEANAALDQGRAVDAEGIRQLLERDESSRSQEPIDSTLTSAEVESHLLAARAGADPGVRAGGLLAPASIAGAAGILLMGFGLAGPFRRHAALCGGCGVAFCRRCQSPAAGADLCTQCHALSLRRDGLSAAVRRDKIDEIGRHEEWRLRLARIASVVAPGAGQIVSGVTGRGLALLSLWVVLAALPLAARSFLVGAVPPIGVRALAVAALCAAIVVWIVALLPFRARRGERAAA